MNTTTPQVNALPRTYAVRTLGCQMNEHDSERMAGLLEQAGLVPVDTVPEAAARATDAGDMGADVIVINTCSVRENAATRLFGNLGQLAAVKRERPGMQIAVGGCLAQQMRDGIVSKAPWVDAVFGTHNIDVLPALLRRPILAATPRIRRPQVPLRPSSAASSSPASSKSGSYNNSGGLGSRANLNLRSRSVDFLLQTLIFYAYFDLP